MLCYISTLFLSLIDLFKGMNTLLFSYVCEETNERMLAKTLDFYTNLILDKLNLYINSTFIGKQFDKVVI